MFKNFFRRKKSQVPSESDRSSPSDSAGYPTRPRTASTALPSPEALAKKAAAQAANASGTNDSTKSPTEDAPSPSPAPRTSQPPSAVIKTPSTDGATPEELCGITPGMSVDEIRELLAFLYKRHNHAAGSLNDALRLEGEKMLDVIVQMREKYL